MSFLNGIGALGAGLNTFAGNAVKDEEARPVDRSLLNAAPPAATAEPSAESPPAADAKPSVAGVPAEYLPLYAAASKRTGIPIDVLIAQAKQESGFNPDAVGSAGEIGLHQVKPSTAADPGFGLKGIDPKTLADPATNINFAADYLKARGGAGLDFNDPASVDRALAAYNSGGDKNYVANVRRHMGAA